MVSIPPARSLAITSIKLGPSIRVTGSAELNRPEASMSATCPLTLTVASGAERPATVTSADPTTLLSRGSETSTNSSAGWGTGVGVGVGSGVEVAGVVGVGAVVAVGAGVAGTGIAVATGTAVAVGTGGEVGVGSGVCVGATVGVTATGSVGSGAEVPLSPPEQAARRSDRARTPAQAASSELLPPERRNEPVR